MASFETTSLRLRIIAAVETAAVGPLGPRKLSRIMERVAPLVAEARAEGESWHRIAEVMSNGLLKDERPSISPATLRGMMRRLPRTQLLTAVDHVDGGVAATVARDPCSLGHFGGKAHVVDCNRDLNDQSRSETRVCSHSVADRMRRLRHITNSEVE